MSKIIISKGQRRKQYAEFCNAIEKFVPRLKKEIDDKKTISIQARDLAKEMGPKFQEKHPISFYWGTKFCLWDSGIHVEAKTKDHEPILLMRARTPEDKYYKIFGKYK
jgi:hypothetical protein